MRYIFWPPVSALVAISPTVTPQTFSGMTTEQLTGFILGTAFTLCKIVGVIAFIWGVYGYITARKNGDANDISIAMIKLVFGILMIWLPQILRAIGIVV